MRRWLLAVSLALVGSDVASAGPITWPFYARFQAADSAGVLGLGTAQWPDIPGGPPKQYYLSYETGSFGPSRIGFVTEAGTQELFDFSRGWWGVSDVRPDPARTAANAFDLWWGFTEGSEWQAGIDRGHASISDVSAPGTGNARIELDETHAVTLGGHQARVHFYSENRGSKSQIFMTVSDVVPVNTPEPATVLLASVGIAGLGLWRRMR